MSDMHDLIDETAAKMLRDLCTKELVDEAEAGTWPEALWETLEESGLTLASVPEARGGGGGDLADAMTILRQAGRRACPLPLAETFLAGWLLTEAGLDVPRGPLTLAAPFKFGREDEQTQDGCIHRVPWARNAQHICVVVEGEGGLNVALVERGACTLEEQTNIAGEARDTVRFDAASLNQDAKAALPDALSLEDIFVMGALTRSVLMAGALETVLELSVEHANVRFQFGRAIGSFQAVRQQLAVLAGHVAAASASADRAVIAASGGEAALDIAVAKARVGEAAGKVTEISHQVHGAMGITHEHSLHHFTRRLWSWRDEYGAEVYWQRVIGRRVAQAGADNLWNFVTQT